MVKKILRSDLDRALTLCRRVFDRFQREDYGNLGTLEFYRYTEWNSIKNKILYDDFVIFGFYLIDELIGIIAIRNRKHISLLFVDEPYQHIGVGSILVDYSKAYCKKNNIVRSLSVNSSMYAMEFYKRLGFSIKNNIIRDKNGIRYIVMTCII